MRTLEDGFGSRARARPRAPKKGRAGAVIVTALAHLAAIFILQVSLSQGRGLRTEDIMVSISHPREIVRNTPPPPPVPDAPSVIAAFNDTPPPPVVMIAPAASPALAAPVIAAGPPRPPMLLPSPPNANDGGSNAGPSWETALLARVAAAKRYPVSTVKLQGVVLLRFSMDRDGNLLMAKIERSSGSQALDSEALAALQRAVPLPRPPPEVAGNVLDLIVPVDFYDLSKPR